MTDQLRADLARRLATLEANHGSLDPGGVERGQLLRQLTQLRPRAAEPNEPVNFDTATRDLTDHPEEQA